MTASNELERLARLGWVAGGRADAAHHHSSGVHAVGPRADVDYPTAGLAALGLHGGAGYWFDHRAGAVVEALTAATDARAIWDVGAGTGAMAVRLAGAGFDVVAVEPIREGASAIAAHGNIPVFCATLDALALPSASLRIIGLFDVIEHLSDPRPLLHEARRVLEPRGVVVLTVPAFEMLWSTEDDVAGHHRRYTRRQLDALIESCGFRTIRSEYLFASLLPPAAVLRAVPYRLGRRRSAERVHAATARQLAPNRYLDRAARAILRAERALGRRARLPAGLSVLGVYAATDAIRAD